MQTEDKGLDSPIILSLVYAGGTILASKRSPYGDLIEQGFSDEVLAELPTDGTMHGLRAAVDELDRLAASSVEGARVAIRRPSLDDVFLAITAGPDEPARDADLIGTKGRS